MRKDEEGGGERRGKTHKKKWITERGESGEVGRGGERKEVEGAEIKRSGRETEVGGVEDEGRKGAWSWAALCRVLGEAGPGKEGGACGASEAGQGREPEVEPSCAGSGQWAA